MIELCPYEIDKKQDYSYNKTQKMAEKLWFPQLLIHLCLCDHR